MSKKRLILIIIILLALVAAVIAGVADYFLRQQDGFIRGSKLNGEDIAGKTVDELTEQYEGWMSSLGLQLIENDEVALEGKLSDCGYSFDEERFRKVLSDEEHLQKTDFLIRLETLILGSKIDLTDSFTLDKKKYAEFVKSSSFKEPRVKSEHADYVYNEKTDLLDISTPIQGNEIDDGKLQKYVAEQIEEKLKGNELPHSTAIEITVPEEVYSSEKVSMDISPLEAKMDEANVDLRKRQLKEMEISYEFGSETHVLKGDDISSWAEVSDDLKITVDEESLREYVEELGAEFNTRYLPRTFNTTLGTSINIDASRNEYGYIINTDEEVKQLKKDIEAHKSLRREPVYFDKNSYGNPLFFGRKGKDDLNGTYVEVNLSMQHLWFYSGGKLVVESDLVSGCTEKGTGTITGCFPLAFKKSPATLEGEIDDDSWSSDVEYWMPFYAGQGLHDATWRGSFGGNIYKYNGSHGCVNLPFNAARTIYNNITPGTAIVLYY